MRHAPGINSQVIVCQNIRQDIVGHLADALYITIFVSLVSRLRICVISENDLLNIRLLPVIILISCERNAFDLVPFHSNITEHERSSSNWLQVKGRTQDLVVSLVIQQMLGKHAKGQVIWEWCKSLRKFELNVGCIQFNNIHISPEFGKVGRDGGTTRFEKINGEEHIISGKLFSIMPLHIVVKLNVV
ncbi:hypothetical protein SDC9_127547 [bioreactor metagenome]|uniref:Uncharacterized protein n=1 Tax=bioreactor metagenome TaxID=1076179 RepID=A0A645CTQ6_9ZZZZ